MDLSLLIIASGIIYCFKILLNTYRKSSNKEQKSQILLMLLGIPIVTFIGVLLQIILPLLFSVQFSSALTSLSFVLQVIFIYIPIKKYNFLSIKFSDITHTIFNSDEDIFIVINNNGTVIDFNQIALSVFPKISQSNIHISKVIDSDINLDKSKKIQEISIKEKNEIKNFIYSKNAIFRKNNKIGSILIIRDITEIKSLQEQLVQRQKLESIGILAAGISHEINTPIQFLSDNYIFIKDGITKIINLMNFPGASPRGIKSSFPLIYPLKQSYLSPI